MKKNSKIIIAVLVVVGVIAIALGFNQERKLESKSESKTNESTETAQETGKKDETRLETKSTVKESKTESGAPADAKSEGGSNEQGKSETPNAPIDVQTNNTDDAAIVIPDENMPTPSEDVNKSITLPYQIPGTDLVLEKIKGFNGQYIEDGTNSEVNGINAALITNKGSQNLEYARVVIEQNGVPLHFKLSALPAGASVIVQEEEKKPYQDGEYRNVAVDLAALDQFEMSEGSIRVEAGANGAIKLTNTSAADIPCVRIFYKYYMNDQSVYIGGITYTAKIVGLKAGESKEVRPSHYDAEDCQIMMVRTYDTAD